MDRAHGLLSSRRLCHGRALIGTFIALFLATGAVAWATNVEQVVVLKEGNIGKAEWGAWLEPDRAKGQADKVCRNIALSHPVSGGLRARSEFRECSSVTETVPVIESLDEGDKSKRRTVWLGLFAPNVATAFLRIGRSSGETVHVRKLRSGAAAKLGTDRLGFWVRGFAGNACLHRLIAYDGEGNVLSDSGKEPC
jgi:hypothetical protein